MGDDWKPESERTTWTTIAIILCCIILFFFGSLIQQYSEPPDGYTDLLKKCVIAKLPSQDCFNTINIQHERGHSFEALNFILSVGDTIKAISIGLIVSVLVSNFFERNNRIRLNSALALKAQQISLNVFDALFGNSHPPAVLSTIKDILSKPVARERFDVTYTLSTWSGEDGTRIAGRDYIKVEASLSAISRNIADPGLGSSSNYRMPIALSLPNPLIDELKASVMVISVRINGRELDKEKIDSANLYLQEKLAVGDKLADVYIHFCDHDLRPGEAIRVQMDYIMMKELEDTEVLRSAQLAQALTLTVIDKSNAGLEIRARAIHPSALDEAGNTDSYLRWELNDIILPQQGIMVWWKKRLASAPNLAT